MVHWVKDPILPQPSHRLQLWHRFNPQPGNLCMPWVRPKEKKERKKPSKFEDLMGSIQQFMNQAASHLVNKRELVGAVRNGELEFLPWRSGLRI